MGFGDWIKDKWNKTKEKFNETVEKVKEGGRKIKKFFSGEDKVNLIDPGDEETKRLRNRVKQLEYEKEQAKRSEEEQKRVRRERENQEKIRKEKQRKSEIKHRSMMFDQYQDKVALKAEAYETKAKEHYINSYSAIISELGKYMNVEPINKFIVKKSSIFKDKMRDEVNSKINLTNKELTSIMDDLTLDFEIYCKKIQTITDQVYYSSRQNLLTLLQQVGTDTNEFIMSYAQKFITEELDAIKSHKETLENLSKEGELKDKQLLKSAQEYATLLYINEMIKQNHKKS